MRQSSPPAPADVAAAGGLSEDEVVRRSAGGAARTALIGLFCRAAGLLTTLLCTHFLSQGQLGNANLAMIIALVVGTGTLLSPQQALLTRSAGFEPAAELVHGFATGSGLLIAALLFVLRGPLCALFGQPEAAPLLGVYCAALVLERLALIPMLRLRYELRFLEVSRCELWGDLCYLGVTVSTAVAGIGPLCLALGMVGRHGARVAYLWRLGEPLRLKMPSLPRAEVARLGREIFARSWPVHLGGFAEYLTLYLDNLFVGRLFGASGQGVYAVAYTLIMTPTDTIALYGATALVRALGVADDARRRETYLTGLRYMSLVLFPLGAGVALCAATLEAAALPTRWHGVAGLTLGLLGASLSTGLMRLAFAHLTAIHRVRLAGVVEGLRLVFFVLALAAIALWAPALTSIGYAVSVAFMLSSLVALGCSLRADGISLAQGVGALMPPALATMLMAAGLLALRRGAELVPGLPQAGLLVVEVAVGAGMYVAALRVLFPAVFATAWTWLRRRGR